MREIWTLTKPMLLAVKRTDGSPFMTKASAIVVVEQVGFPENGLQRAMVIGYVPVADDDLVVRPLDYSAPGGEQNQRPVLMEVAVRNVVGKATIK